MNQNNKYLHPSVLQKSVFNIIKRYTFIYCYIFIYYYRVQPSFVWSFLVSVQTPSKSTPLIELGFVRAWESNEKGIPIYPKTSYVPRVTTVNPRMSTRLVWILDYSQNYFQYASVCYGCSLKLPYVQTPTTYSLLRK